PGQRMASSGSHPIRASGTISRRKMCCFRLQRGDPNNRDLLCQKAAQLVGRVRYLRLRCDPQAAKEPHRHRLSSTFMPKFAWLGFTERSYDLHLIVAHAPAGSCEDPASLMKLLIDRLQPEGDFALSREEANSETMLLCAFAQASDASIVIDALAGYEENLH